MKSIRRLDLHIHSTWSDGSVTPPKILKYSASKDFFVAITDHFSLNPVKRSRVLDQVHAYLDELQSLKKEFKFLVGLEIDTYSIPNFSKFLNSLPLHRFDFLLFEYVIDQIGISFFPKRSNWQEILLQIGNFVTQLPSNKLPVGLAHPHLGVLSNKEFQQFSRIIYERAFFLELNTHYNNFRELRFHTLLNEGYSVTIGTDSHSLDGIARTESLFDFFKEEELINGLVSFVRNV